MNDEEFYARCADLLGTVHEYLPFTHYARTRWNNRKPGSGRFPGCGIIRIFGDEIHIAIRAPIAIHERVRGKRNALRLIEERLRAEGRTTR
jgi:hypothetical protein